MFLKILIKVWLMSKLYFLILLKVVFVFLSFEYEISFIVCVIFLIDWIVLILFCMDWILDIIYF